MIHVTWCWNREDWNQCSKWRTGQAKMCRRNLGFQRSKKTTKGQFLIFFHGKVLFYTYSLKTICNFHMTTEKNQIFIAVAGDELSSTIHNSSCLYFERSKRACYVQKFFWFRVRNIYPWTLNFAGKLERFWNWWTDVIWVRTKKFKFVLCYQISCEGLCESEMADLSQVHRNENGIN